MSSPHSSPRRRQHRHRRHAHATAHGVPMVPTRTCRHHHRHAHAVPMVLTVVTVVTVVTVTVPHVHVLHLHPARLHPHHHPLCGQPKTSSSSWLSPGSLQPCVCVCAGYLGPDGLLLPRVPRMRVRRTGRTIVRTRARRGGSGRGPLAVLADGGRRAHRRGVARGLARRGFGRDGDSRRLVGPSLPSKWGVVGSSKWGGRRRRIRGGPRGGDWPRAAE